MDQERCFACWTCTLVCPLGAIRRDKKHGKTVEYDLHEEEIALACVTNCPNDTLVHVEAQDGSPNAEIKVKRFKEYGGRTYQ